MKNFDVTFNQLYEMLKFALKDAEKLGDSPFEDVILDIPNEKDEKDN